MSLGLPNAKFNAGQPVQRLGLSSRKYKVTTSVAEGAIFIPKPHKRVKFKLDAPGMKLPGGGQPANEPIPLPGGGKRAEANVADSMTRGDLGPNGLTARFNHAAWAGNPGGYVRMEVDYTPNKQGEVIATQEEGRQVNHGQVHFSQQYDAYGRPRIGFSREPYDFAATKFISTTSQIAFQSNMARVHEEYDKYLLNGSGAGEDTPKVMGQDEGESGEVPIFGATSDPAEKQSARPEDIKPLGPESGVETGPKKVSAKESFDAQRVKIVNESGGGKAARQDNHGAEENPVDALFAGDIDTSSLRTLDVSA